MKYLVLIIWTILMLVIGWRIGVSIGNYKSEPKSKYDCLKLGSDTARIACVKIYFPKK